MKGFFKKKHIEEIAKGLRNIFSFIVAFIVFFLFIQISVSNTSFRDVFTTSRITALENRAPNITKDIFVDVSVLGEQGGIKTLTENVLSKIAIKRPNWRFIVCRIKNSKVLDNAKQLPNVKFIEISNYILLPKVVNFIEMISSGIVRDKLVQLLTYNDIVFDRHINLIWDPVGESNIINSTLVPRISTIHDLAWFEPKGKNFLLNYDELNDIRHDVIRKTAMVSDQIITVSHFSRKRILDEFQLPTDRVRAIPIQLAKRVLKKHTEKEIKDVLTKYGLKKHEYFIFCSTWWGNKNHKNLMLAFEKFIQNNNKIKLLIVGRHAPMKQYGFWRTIKDETKKRIIITDFIPNDELDIALQNALAFVHPSVYEGFGIPLVEAMEAGIPIACSNVSSLPEVAGDAAIQFDPYNIDEIAIAMTRLANDENLRIFLIQKGYTQVKKYDDVDEMINQYIKVMEENMK